MRSLFMFSLPMQAERPTKMRTKNWNHTALFARGERQGSGAAESVVCSG